MLEEEAALLEGTEGFQVIWPKYKKAPPGDDADCQPSKKAKGKQPVRYWEDIGDQVGGANLCERCVHTRQDCLVHNLRWVKNFLYVFFFTDRFPLADL